MLLHNRSLTHSEADVLLLMAVLISMQENDKFLGNLKCLSGERGLERGKTSSAHFIMMCGSTLKKDIWTRQQGQKQDFCQMGTLIKSL